MIRIVKDLLVCDVKADGVGQRFPRSEVAGVTGVCAAGDDHAHAVALPVSVCRRPEFDVNVAGPVD